jgi:hypothetical protein
MKEMLKAAAASGLQAPLGPSFMSFSIWAERPFADILTIEQHIHVETGEFSATASEMVNTAVTGCLRHLSEYMMRLASGPRVHAP